MPSNPDISDGVVVHALIVDAARRVLLFATNRNACTTWTVPGRRRGVREDAAAAICRILHSVNGQDVASLTGPPTATHPEASGGRNLYYLCPVGAFQLSRGDALTSELLQQALVDFPGAGHRSAAHLAQNPDGRGPSVPVIVTEGSPKGTRHTWEQIEAKPPPNGRRRRPLESLTCKNVDNGSPKDTRSQPRTQQRQQQLQTSRSTTM